MSAKDYCMSSYLMYRYVFDVNQRFYDDVRVNITSLDFERKSVKTSDELINVLSEMVERETSDGKAAIALSGGMDSAILAKFMPEGSKAYTFRCVVPGKKVIDESGQAAVWAKEHNLEHEVIDITWEEVKSAADTLMIHKGAPIHSIETQIYLAALKARKDGASRFIFGENADIIYGGMDGLLKKEWLFGEFMDRYMYVNPYHVLRNPEIILEPFQEFEDNGYIDGYNFINKYFRQEALGTYNNACETAGIQFVGPYSQTCFGMPIDYSRIRAGETKYIVREAFYKLYPGAEAPDKIPMPRPVNEWFENWTGPVRDEFYPHCTDNMAGDQKWMVWALERFLDLLEGVKDEMCCDRTCG